MIIQYEIVAGEKTPCELWSVIKTAPYENEAVRKKLCEGTHTYCNKILKEIEQMGG